MIGVLYTVNYICYQFFNGKWGINGTLTRYLLLLLAVSALTGCFWEEREAINLEYRKSLYETLYIQSEFSSSISNTAESQFALAIW